jgi:transcriptional regulator with XRE-family HTH domain
MRSDNFGLFLLKCRKENGLTQQQLAEKLYVSNSTIYKWEKGISRPGLEMYDKLAEVLNVSVDDLIYCAKNDTSTIVKATKVPSDSEEVCNQKTAGINYNIILGIVGLVVLLLVGFETVHNQQNKMRAVVVDEFFQNKSVYNKSQLYNVIIEYEGAFDDEFAYEFSTSLRDTYSSWFSQADGILIQFVDEYEGREKLDNVVYKMVLMPKRNEE